MDNRIIEIDHDDTRLYNVLEYMKKNNIAYKLNHYVYVDYASQNHRVIIQIMCESDNIAVQIKLNVL